MQRLSHDEINQLLDEQMGEEAARVERELFERCRPRKNRDRFARTSEEIRSQRI